MKKTSKKIEKEILISETPEEIGFAAIIKRIASEKAEAIIVAAKLQMHINSDPVTFEVSISEMESKSRKTEFVIVRHLAISIIHELTGMCLKGIGRQFQNRDHSSIIHGINKTEEIRYTVSGFDKVYKEVLEKCSRSIDAAKVMANATLIKTPPPTSSNPVDKELSHLAVSKRVMLDYSKNSTPVKRSA